MFLQWWVFKLFTWLICSISIRREMIPGKDGYSILIDHLSIQGDLEIQMLTISYVYSLDPSPWWSSVWHHFYSELQLCLQSLQVPYPNSMTDFNFKPRFFLGDGTSLCKKSILRIGPCTFNFCLSNSKENGHLIRISIMKEWKKNWEFQTLFYNHRAGLLLPVSDGKHKVSFEA